MPPATSHHHIQTLPPTVANSSASEMRNLQITFRGARFPVKFLTKPRPSSASPTLIQVSSRNYSPRHFPKKPPSTPFSPTPFSPGCIWSKPTPPSNLSEAITELNSDSHHLEYDYNVFNSVLHSLSSVSTLDDSILFFDHMVKNHSSNFYPNYFTFHTILSISLKSEPFSQSSLDQVLTLMTSHGFPPNSTTTDSAVRTLCSIGRFKEAVDVTILLSLKQAPPEMFTYNFLVKSLLKNRRSSSAHSFMDEMRTRFGYKPDLDTYTIMIDRFCNRKNLSEAMGLLEVLNLEGLKPDAYVYNTIMKGFGMLSQGDDLLSVYKDMEEGGVKPDRSTFNTLVSGLSKAGRVKDAMDYLKLMVEMGHVPDVVTYNSLMNGMLSEGNMLGALSLLEEMERKGCAPKSSMYNTLLHGLCKPMFLDKGVELFGAMKAGEMKLNIATFGTLVRALVEDGRVTKAYELFDYAVESKSLIKKEHVLEALSLLEEMEKKGCAPYACTYNALLRELCKPKFLDKGVELYVVMKAKEMKLDDGTYGALVKALVKDGQVAKAYEVLDYAVESKSLADISAYSTLESTIVKLQKAREEEDLDDCDP